MSIEKLEDILQSCHKEGKPSFYCVEAASIFIKIIDILKHQSDQIADLRQELAKKEDVIDINDIKEVKNING